MSCSSHAPPPKGGVHRHFELGRTLFAMNTVVSHLAHIDDCGNLQEQGRKVRIPWHREGIP